MQIALVENLLEIFSFCCCSYLLSIFPIYIVLLGWPHMLIV